ncbi:hypothetical protein J4E00_16560, partial [Siccationidurans soli]|nr:hypothetical protein [Hymenobacter negativus]
ERVKAIVPSRDRAVSPPVDERYKKNSPTTGGDRPRSLLLCHTTTRALLYFLSAMFKTSTFSFPAVLGRTLLAILLLVLRLPAA